jgi:hypothetical protein
METTLKERGGAIDALVNYWITKITYRKTAEPTAVPEFNLESGGAQSALDSYLAGRKLHEGIAFDLGIRLAGIVSRTPLNAEAEVFAAIEDAISASKAIAQDRAEYEAQKAGQEVAAVGL